MCSQSVGGRHQGKEPRCSAICFRRVFAHEIRNIRGYKSHQKITPDGTAKYPLPFEGQPQNLPRFLGKPVLPRGQDNREQDVKYWEEGWYVGTVKGRNAVAAKMQTMMLDLPQQQIAFAELRKRGYANLSALDSKPPTPGEFLDKTFPNKHAILNFYCTPRQNPDMVLVPLPPAIPQIWTRVEKLLVPTYRMLEIFRDSVTSGEQKRFAQRVWEMAWSNEPFELANKTVTQTLERMKKGNEPGGQS